MISAEDHKRLQEAIRVAEAGTAGEIVVVLARQANAYRATPLLGAFLLGLMVPWPLIVFTALGPTRIFLMQVGVTLALTVLFSLPPLRLALVPRSIKRARAEEAAQDAFMSQGLTRTKGRTGILIYLALAERHAAIIADHALADRVEQGVWEGIIAELTGAIGAGRAGEGLLRAVQRAGAILAEHAPRQEDDRDELPNRVIVL